MFNTVLSLIIGVLVGWNFHLFYSELGKIHPISLPKQDVLLSQNLTKLSCKEIEIDEKKLEYTNLSDKSDDVQNSSFEALLNQNNFFDAMAFYTEANETELIAYQLKLKSYFYNRAEKFPNKTIEEMLYYIDIEYQSQEIQLYLAKLYRDKKEFEKAIKLLVELQDRTEHKVDENLLKNDLNSTIETYISELTNTKDFPQLISFLEKMIYKYPDNQKYLIRLASLYAKLDNHEKVHELLEEIEHDSTYSAKANTLLKEIEIKQRELAQYTHTIPLNKIGSQYSINLTINSTPLILLLDTGASYTFIDEEKIPSLTIEKEIILNTAGGEIVANLCHAQNLIIQDIELRDFKVTTASFKQQDADGLLGMNFFEEFNFKIDQEKQLLYLAKKINR
jgi:predicted aspartyl protease